MLSKGVVKVRKLPEAATDDMYHYLMPLIQKQPDNVILHVGTNDPSFCNSSEIVNNILKLRWFISQKIAKCKYYFIETDYEIRHSNWKSYY